MQFAPARARARRVFAAWRRGGAAAAMLGALCAAAPAHALDLEVYTRANGKAKTIVAKNPHPAPVHLRIQITESDNVAGVPAALEVVVPPRREVALATASPVRGDRPMSFSFRRIYSLGDPAARHDDRALYRLPFENGRVFRITQAPGGYATTHDSPDTRHAVDIAMPVGTRVVAARGGVVVENVRDFHEGGPDVAFLKQANLVRILHDDGTWGEYAHLARRSSPLVPGQRIEAGDFVGLSGNSGYTSGPHLHFVVKRNGGDDDVSVPIRFYTAALGRFELREGMEIAAVYDSRRIVARPAAGVPDAVGASGAAESVHPR